VPDAKGSCVGVAFEFPDSREVDVLNYLQHREGRGFVFSNVKVVTKALGQVEAIVALYEGNNVLSFSTGQALVSSIEQAHGTSGSCSSYVKRIYDQLTELGIDDPAVTKIYEQLRAARVAGQLT
jgi:cation transport protein ChaC